jgi:hypothetical protein
MADLCPTAQPIALPATVAGNLLLATDNSHDRIEVTGYAWAGPDQFFALSLAAGQSVAITLSEQGFDGGVYLFTDCNNIAGSTVGGADTTPGSPYTFVAPASGRYILAVDAWIANTGGPYTLTVIPTGGGFARVPPPTPAVATAPMPAGPMGVQIASPLSDHCATAQPVGVPSTISGNLATATDDSHDRIEVTGYAWAGPDQFFAVVLVAGQSIRLTLDDRGGFDGGVYVFTDCNNIAGSTAGGADTTPSSPYTFVAPASGRYLIAVDSWIANTSGPYTLTIQPAT